MSMRFCIVGVASAALLAAAALFSPAPAKPPDLPAKQYDTCTGVGAGLTLPASGVTRDEKTSRDLTEVDSPSMAETLIDTVCPCFLEAFGQFLQVLGLGSEKAAAGPAEEAEYPAAPQSPPCIPAKMRKLPVTDPLPEAPNYTCPYLKQKAAEQAAPPCHAASQPGDVLENLDKLEKARKIYRKAERLRKSDEVEKACHCYEEVKHLCPGSHYDRLATERLQQLNAQRTTESGQGVGEEEEKTPAKKEDPDNKPQSKEPKQQELLLQIWLSGLESDAEPVPLPPAAQEVEKPTPGLRPALPPVDPKIVDALEKVLGEAGEPARAKLVIQSEQTAGDPEEPGAPPPHWSSDPSASALPGVVGEPAEQGPSAEEDEPVDQDADSPGPNLVELLRNWNDLLRDGAETLEAGACPDIDNSNLERLELVSVREMGKLMVTMVADSDGVYRGLVVALLPEASGDLRAAQRAHNEQVLQWIASMNHSRADACDEPTLTEDEDLDDDPDVCAMVG